MRPPAVSLFAKILSWLFLNVALVAAIMTVFFFFQPQISLYAIFDQQGTSRLRTAGMLIAHDLDRTPRAQWSDVLAGYAAIHRVDFALVLADRSHLSSTDMNLPASVTEKAGKVLRRGLPNDPFPPGRQRVPPRPLRRHRVEDGLPDQPAMGRKPPKPPESGSAKPHFMMRTANPARYWAGLRIPLPAGPMHPPEAAVLLAVSDAITGNGFFFDPLPWMVAAASVLLLSVLFWMPMVRHITRPLSRMTRAAEKIARGRFDVPIHVARNDEIGRLGKAINHMTARLAAFVTGQKRFLGDVAHELGSPIARIQFGLGVLDQRLEGENRQRVNDVIDDVDHLSKLVNELLAFSRAEMKSRTVQLESIDLFAVVDAAVKREQSPAARIDVHLAPGLRVVASSELLTRALSNLLRNAVNYAADAGPIDVIARKDNDGVEIQVRDMGPGVPEDLIDQLFEPFFRPEASRDRASGGVGLGLAIVKTCVETCQGTVSAANLKPKGFAATITLRS